MNTTYTWVIIQYSYDHYISPSKDNKMNYYAFGAAKNNNFRILELVDSLQLPLKHFQESHIKYRRLIGRFLETSYTQHFAKLTDMD